MALTRSFGYAISYSPLGFTYNFSAERIAEGEGWGGRGRKRERERERERGA